MVSPGFEELAKINIRNTKARQSDKTKLTRLHSAAVSLINKSRQDDDQSFATVPATALTELSNALVGVLDA